MYVGRRVRVDLKERLAQFRAEEQRLSWEGTFLEYFEIVKAQPQVAGLAHARVHDMIMSQGASNDEHGRKVFGFFKHDIFGVEKPLEQLVEYFNSAGKRLEVRKRILLLMGPVGGGKSTIVSLLKRGMEDFARTEEGAVYAIKGWPLLRQLRRRVASARRPCSRRCAWGLEYESISVQPGARKAVRNGPIEPAITTTWSRNCLRPGLHSPVTASQGFIRPFCTMSSAGAWTKTDGWLGTGFDLTMHGLNVQNQPSRHGAHRCDGEEAGHKALPEIVQGVERTDTRQGCERHTGQRSRASQENSGPGLLSHSSSPRLQVSA